MTVSMLSEYLHANDESSKEATVQAFNRPYQAALATIGLPHRKTENWRYSNRYLKPGLLKLLTAEPSIKKPFNADNLLDVGGIRLVFVDGILDQALSRFTTADGNPVAGVNITQLSDQPDMALGSLLDLNKLPFAQLNSAQLGNALMIAVDANTQVQLPIHIIFQTQESTSASPRVLLSTGTGAQLSIIEEFLAENVHQAALTNSVTEIDIGANSELTHIRLSLEPEHASHIGATAVSLKKDANYFAHNVGFGGALRRHDLTIKLSEPGAHCSMNGVFVTQGSQHYDNQTCIEHIAPQCTSNQVYRNIAADASHAIFAGRIHILRDAQKSAASMSNKNLLLSNHAEIDTKPELEIYADDVKCAHGATVGQLDHDALFYLIARGISPKDAAIMLSMAFINELIEQIPLPAVQALVAARFDNFMSGIYATQPEQPSAKT